MDRFSLKNLNEVDVRQECQLNISKSVADLENLDDKRDTGLATIL
jgi:hypothetical protein